MARVPYLTREELPPGKQPIYDRIQETRGAVHRPFSALLNSPDAAEKVAAVGEYARFHSSLDPVVREMVILTVARELDSQYEWTHHEPIARRAGLRDEVIEAIRDRKAPQGLIRKEAVFIQYTQELLRRRKVTDATFQAVVHLLGTQGTTDLTVTIAYYTMLAHILAAFEVELEEDNPPLLPV